MTSQKVYRAVEKRLQLMGYKFHVRNCYLFDGWESDILAVDHEEKIVEIEVKVSRSDFIADFNKDEKHRIIANGNGPSRFYYAAPEGVVNPDDVPNYAGLLVVQDRIGGGCYEFKRAPTLHNDIVRGDEWKKLAQLLYARL